MSLQSWLGRTAAVCVLVGMGAGLASAQTAKKHAWAIQVHAGAGDIFRAQTSPELDAAERAKIAEAIQAGAAVLDKGGSSMDAVEAAIRIFEDATLFDTGRGAAFNDKGVVELDAAIMNGKTLDVGSIAAVHNTKHPISLARKVIEKSPHVLIVGEGADAFSREQGLEQAPQSYFFSEKQWETLEQVLKEQGKPIPPRPTGVPAAPKQQLAGLWSPHSRHYGTVGVVALDREGNLAAGTSTGGAMGKHAGRVGDSPIAGAGTYASNKSCAVSGTGVGEYFIRLGVAREVCNLIQYKGMTAQQAADEVIHTEVESLKGVGGVIVETPDGQQAWSFNTPGMFRARLREGGPLTVAIYNDEK
jgi:beta-aspartyl-peptidase (threonine type)